MDPNENVDNSLCDPWKKLPIEICNMILGILKSSEDRNNARLVCKLWEESLNRDCSGEKLYIPKYAPFNSKEWSLLMNSKRRHINYHITQTYGNMEEYDEFFAQRGDSITSLQISECSLSIPRLQMILSNCRHLKKLIISTFDYGSLRHLCEEELRHDLLTNLIMSPLDINQCFLNPSELIDAIGQIRRVLPELQRLEMQNVKEFPDANHLRILQNLKYNMVIVGNDISGNQFTIDERNNAHVNIKYAKFTLDSSENTFTTNYTSPYGTTEESLLQFMTQHNNLENLRINFNPWNFKTLNFPPIGYNIGQTKLMKVKINGVGTVVLGHSPILFNNLKALILDSCEVQNFSPENIALMTNMKTLSITNISYPALLAVCEHMLTLRSLTIEICTGFNKELHRTELQQHLENLKVRNLRYIRAPADLLDTEEE